MATTISLSPLVISISMVVGTSAKKQVTRITASPIVAMVTCKQTGRDCTARKVVRHTVSLYLLAV